MKAVTLFALFFTSFVAVSQSSVVPKEIKFSRSVVQKMNDKKTNTITYLYTESGDYAAIRPDEKNNGALIIYDKNGKMMIVSEKEKTIMIMDMKPFLDRAVKKSEEMASDKKEGKSATGSFKKTGNTKTICNYPAEEYEVTTEKGKMNIWYVKTDFVSFPLLGMMGKGPMGGKGGSAGGDWSEVPGLGKNFLMAELEKDGKKAIETVSISKADYTFSSVGYTVRDMSELMKGNYGQ